MNEDLGFIIGISAAIGLIAWASGMSMHDLSLCAGSVYIGLFAQWAWERIKDAMDKSRLKGMDF